MNSSDFSGSELVDNLFIDENDEEYIFDTRTLFYYGEIKQVGLLELLIKVSSYLFVMIISLVGNAFVIIVVWRNKRMWTSTNFYIVNLAIADLMVTLACQWVHLVDDLTEGWVLGAFFCRFNSCAQVLSLVSSILTLMVIACDRFFGIVFAMKAHISKYRGSPAIISIWVCSLLISTPLLKFRQESVREWANHTEIWCADTWPAVLSEDPITNATLVTYPSRTFYYTTISLVLYFLPIVVMTSAYLLIILKLWSNSRPDVSSNDNHGHKKKKVVIMLIVILAVFGLCWLPLQITILYGEHRSDFSHTLPSWYEDFRYFATFLAYSNSGLNPVIYTCFSESFRQGFKDTLLSSKQRRARQYTGTKNVNNCLTPISKRREDKSPTTRSANCSYVEMSQLQHGHKNEFTSPVVSHS